MQIKLSNRKVHNLQVTLLEVKSIVAADEKQRYSLIPKAPPITSKSPTEESGLDQNQTEVNAQDGVAATSTEPSDFLIRANQGHSMKVEDKGLHTPITEASGNLPQLVVHGTQKQLWPKILASGGLKPMSRKHVHFATGVPPQLGKSFKLPSEKRHESTSDNKSNAEKSLPEAAETTEVAALPDKKDAPVVLSGMRNTSTLLIFLDIRRAMEKGLRFFLSENGVVLCAGNEKGIVPVEFFEMVVEAGGKVLVKDGETS